MGSIKIRLAVMSERKALEALQWRSSLEHAEYKEALLANPDAIELPAAQIESGSVFVAGLEGVIAGFAVLLPRADGDYELDGLFVEPDRWRRGLGRALVEHCCTVARAAGATSLHVVSNPHAEGFYRSCQFMNLGTTDTRFGAALLMRRSV